MAFDALQALQAFGMGSQMAERKRALARQEEQYQRQEQTRARVGDAVGSGDYQGGMQAALAGGEYGLAQTLGGLDETKRKQARDEAQVLGAAASQLLAVPADQRSSAFERMKPMLRQYGFDDNEMAAADLSDQGLNAYVGTAKQVTAFLNPPKAMQPTAFQQDLMAGGIQPGSPEYRQMLQSRYAEDPKIMMIGTRPYQVTGAGPSAQPTSTDRASIMAEAEEAIRAGASREAVMAEVEKMLGGAGSVAPQTFP